jgi:tRNA1(Val) A37 N6-methylase TrmN6
MNTATDAPLVHDELDLLADQVPLGGARIIELGCGAAALARALVQRFADSHVTALEVDERQHAKNLAAPAAASASCPGCRSPSRFPTPASTWC